MRKSTIASVLAIGCLMLAGLAYAKGPRTPVTVTTNAAAFTEVRLVLCQDPTLCAEGEPGAYVCGVIVQSPNATVKYTCETGFKTTAFYGTIFVIDDVSGGESLCAIEFGSPQLVDDSKLFSCAVGAAQVTVKVGNGN